MSKKLKNIGIVASLTIVSRCLGLARDLLSAGIFGAGVAMDAFVTAFSLPNLFRRLLGEGALTAAFVPTLQEELHENGREGAFALLSKVVSWLVGVTGGCVLIGMIGFGQSRLIAGNEQKWYVAADLTVILFPYLACVCLAAAFSAALNVLGRFTESALSPIWLNLAMIASLGFAASAVDQNELAAMHWLCAGVLVGGVLQMMVPALVLVREGWRPRLDFGASPRVRAIAVLMAPGLVGTAIYQINIYVSRLLAFSVSESSATLLFYANRLMELPIGVFAIAVATVVYPLIARHAVERNFVAMAADYRKGLRLILVINVPAAGGLALLSEPIVRLLFEHGKFTPAMTQTMAPLLTLFAFGLPFYSVVSLTTRAFYAVKDTVTPVRVAATSFALNLGLSLLLMGPLDAPGLVLASTVAVIVQTLLLQRALGARLPGMQFGELWTSLAKIFGATLAMVAVVAGGWQGLRHVGRGGHASDVIAIFGLIPLGVAVYGATLWALRIEGREELVAMFAKVRARFGGGPATNETQA
ncbi:MAG: murein biosynthesis integral membrane protein MurJ [Opitutus sp.]|nr:murein biosynthesis integral membrane protein MurJ [Opitutus sp.]